MPRRWGSGSGEGVEAVNAFDREEYRRQFFAAVNSGSPVRPLRKDASPEEKEFHALLKAELIGITGEREKQKKRSGRTRDTEKPKLAAVTPIKKGPLKSVNMDEVRVRYDHLAGEACVAEASVRVAGRAERKRQRNLLGRAGGSGDADGWPSVVRLFLGGLSGDRPKAPADRGRGSIPLVRSITEHVQLPDDIERIKDLATANKGVDLIVIDPVASHIGNSNSNSEAEVRHAIGQLNRLADDLDCLVIGVRHPGKEKDRALLSTILGSTAWVDVPRAVVYIAKDKGDEDLRHIQVIAGNRSRNGKAQLFRIEGVKVEGVTGEITVARALGESSETVEEVMAGRNSKSADARRLILAILDDGQEHESDELDAHVASVTGLSPRTVRDVRLKLGSEGLVKSKQVKDEFGAVLRWVVYRKLDDEWGAS